MTSAKTTTGPTASQGWTVGIRRTFPINTDRAWELLFTQPVLGEWLDKKADLPFQKGDAYTTKNGIHISVSSVTTSKVIRMKWQKTGESNASTLQIRVIPAKEKTTISFHHEWLKDAAEKTTMKTYWENVLDKIATLI